MTTQPWHAALIRWGDPVFRLALLLNDTSIAAEAATVKTFTNVLSAESGDLELDLYAGLLATQRRARWQPARRLRRLLGPRGAVRLPRSLMRLAPEDRALLGLWLLRSLSGAQLVTITRHSAPELVQRLSRTLIELLPPSVLALADTDDQPDADVFSAWVERKLGLASGAPVHLVSDTRHAAEARWQAALDHLRLQLRGALDGQRLPPRCGEAVETIMLARQAGAPTAWWERPAVWTAGVVAGTLLLLLLLVLPRGGLSSASPDAQRPLPPQTAQQIVQQALDGWTTQPISGTLQRTVWALPPAPLPPPVLPRADRSPPAQSAQITNVWMEADSARYRMEVSSDNRVIEWHLGDGTRTLEYAADAWLAHSCPWADSDAVDSLAHSFKASAEQQRDVLTARLTQGAYGQGYHALRRAISATDLRSFGTRVQGKETLLALGFTDRSQTPERRLLLWIDTVTSELRIVQELSSAETGSSARDLWRLEQRLEPPGGIPRGRLDWPQTMLKHDAILDPTCPALDPYHVVSLRTLVTANHWWANQYMPQRLPDDVTRALLVSTNIVRANIASNLLDSPPTETRAIFIGPDRWLRIGNANRTLEPGAGTRRGPWLVNFVESQDGLVATLCNRQLDVNGCFPTLLIAARGWTQQEVLALVDSLTLVNAQSWGALDELFLDPTPLEPAARSTLQRASQAIQPQRDGTLYSRAEYSARTNPNRPTRQDPYHIPLDELSPARRVQEQWQVYADGESARFSELRTLPDGTVLSFQAGDDQRRSFYYRTDGSATIEPLTRGIRSTLTPFTPAEEVLGAVLDNTLPITLTSQPDALVLEQPLPDVPLNGGQIEMQFSQIWYGELPQGSLLRRTWLDPATAMPRRTQIVHVAPRSQETILGEVTLSEWRYLDQPAPETTFQLPPLPDDVIVIDRLNQAGPQIGPEQLGIEQPARKLIWRQASTGVEIISEQDLLPLVYQQPGLIDRMLHIPIAGLDSLDQTGLIQATTYRLPNSAASVTIRQGSRRLLRHLLRHRQPEIDRLGQPDQTSKPLTVTIAGEPRTVWLLDEQPMPALVVEIDQMLLHVSGVSVEVLETEIAPLLAQLQWVALEDQG